MLALFKIHNLVVKYTNAMFVQSLPVLRCLFALLQL